ncbi:MAG: hypothetical protein E6R03_05310 [Hyphomicrobiaceae bacterium]|nr:MAG: hypothetical protein E6R03_05310 [Hyphomicrobiaceae bacterium]
MENHYRIGTDPEMFLFDKKGKFVAACGLFPGTKQEPYKVEGGAIQVDGLALEFNINPADSCEEFTRYIARVLEQIDDMLVPLGLTREFIPYVDIDPSYFASLPDEAKILGCDPDFSGMTGLRKEPPEIGNLPFRTAAGHLHIGWGEHLDPDDPLHFEDCRYVAEHISVHTGNLWYLTAACWQRLKYYGGERAFRPKTYGVEVRSLDNLWVANKQLQVRLYDRVIHEMRLIDKGVPEDVSEKKFKAIQKIA